MFLWQTYSKKEKVPNEISKVLLLNYILFIFAETIHFKFCITMKKTVFVVLLLVILGIAGGVYYNFYFVFGEGVKTGYLNYVVRKGYIFKTYEGKLIQEGFGRGNTGVLTSYEFEFSIENPEIFKKLEVNSGKKFDLYYKEYHNAIPWRGNTRYVVDSIANIRD